MSTNKETNRPEDPVEVMIEGLDPRGFGTFTHDGRHGAVAGGIPGDRVTLERRGHHPLSVKRVVVPAPDRIAPDCEFHGACGGCDLIAYAYPACATAKAVLVERTLREICQTPTLTILPFESAPSTTGYRHRCRLHQSRDRHRCDAGYLPPHGKGIVPITHCALLCPAIARRLSPLRQAIVSLPFHIEEVRVSASTEGPERVAAHVTLSMGTSAKRARPALQEFATRARLSGVTVGHPARGVELVIGDPVLLGAVAPGVAKGPYQFEPAHFTQGNAAMNARMVATVLRWATSAGPGTIVELFAGCGNFTLPLAATGSSVTAVESDPAAVRMAYKNVRRSGLGERIKLVADAAANIRGPASCDVLLLDPPRSGFRELPHVVAEIGPRNIIYVSCDLELFRRDARALIASGYALREGVGFDLYPRTHHIETAAWFARPTA